MLDLKDFENQTIYIVREAYAEFQNPAVLWSTGKDSTTMLWLCRKAFFGKIPFPVIHIDTSYKFRQMYKFRDEIAREWGLNLLVAKNEEAIKEGVSLKDGKFECCTRLKTEAVRKCLEEHGHDSFVADDRLVRREDIEVEFIWDILRREGRKVRVLNVPLVVPPYCFGVDFKPVGFGLPTNEREWQEEVERVTDKTRELLAEGPDLLISVYTLLDRIQHFHWGEDCVVEWYKRLDNRMAELLFDTGFLEQRQNKLIVVSDHGFCSFGEAKVQTLPMKSEWGDLKGDHHENALLITVNLDYQIERPQDVFFALREEFKVD